VWELTPGFDLEFDEAKLSTVPPAARANLLKYSYRNPGTQTYVLCGDDARFFNHSADPSVLCVEEPNIAARDIHPGEELTCDYYTFDTDAAKKLQ
jgi:hypothetical protein